MVLEQFLSSFFLIENFYLFIRNAMVILLLLEDCSRMRQMRCNFSFAFGWNFSCLPSVEIFLLCFLPCCLDLGCFRAMSAELEIQERGTHCRFLCFSNLWSCDSSKKENKQVSNCLLLGRCLFFLRFWQSSVAM